MRLVGLLLLISGWFILPAALALLTALPQRLTFVFAGLAVELLGLGLVARWHRSLKVVAE